MRLWTVHPKYLDSKGLVALWREGLLAKAVLEGRTVGYVNHPQLERFRAKDNAVDYLVEFLHAVLLEARARNYRFDGSKLSSARKLLPQIEETDGQLHYEWEHLMMKLRARNPILHKNHSEIVFPDAHPLFTIVKGEIRGWEKANKAAHLSADPP
ncbi:MAG: pyrimidine dimer DNA glycosylase/endonuclease V [Chthoniobacterales bacterium]